MFSFEFSGQSKGDLQTTMSLIVKLTRRSRREGRSEERTHLQLSHLLLLIYCNCDQLHPLTPSMFWKTLRMLLIKVSKTKDIDKEVRLLRKYELAVREATIQLPCAVKALIRAGALTFSLRVFTPTRGSWT